MKHYIRSILFAAGAFGLVGLVNSATAEACRGEGHGPAGGKRGARLMKMDADNNGVVDRSELTNGMYAKAAKKLERVDANGDGYLEQSEFKALRGKKRARRGKNISEAKRAKFTERGAKRFARVDVDKDGRLSLAEMQAAADVRIEKMIAKLDTNGDGSIGADELPKRNKRNKTH